MKILFVAELYPWPPTTGTPQRVFHVLQALARDHDVTLVSIVHPEGEPDQSSLASEDPLPASCTRIIRVADTSCAFRKQPPRTERERFWDSVRRVLTSPLPTSVQMWDCPELISTLRALSASERFDEVWVERCYIAELVRRAGFTSQVVDVDDVQSVALARLAKQLPWTRWKALLYGDLVKVFLYEQLLPWRFKRLIVCKEADRRFFVLRGSRVMVVPNGIDECVPTNCSAEQPGQVLFVGFLHYMPNIDAVMHFARRIFPILAELSPGVRFTIVGSPVPVIQELADGDRFFVEGMVSDVRPYYEAASIVVVPMRLGSGTRIKVLEALALGKAVVTTSVGAEGLDVRNGVDVAIADDPFAFARACAQLLGDLNARQRLGRNGRERVLERYSWNSIANDVERALLGQVEAVRGR